jgi:OOP family OmpA-OmpF porin
LQTVAPRHAIVRAMKTRMMLLATALLLAIPALAQDKGDAAGCKDPSLFPVRMPNYRIQKCEHKAYETWNFFTSNPRQPKPVEGEYTLVIYAIDSRENERSGVEVVRNYENAFKKIGGKTMAIDPDRRFNGFVTIEGKEVWTEVQKGNGLIWVRTIQRTPMQQTIVADAASFSKDLKTSGHVAVGGIYFDTASAVLKPESNAAIAEIAKMLKSDPGLKVYVVGHTDTVGNVESNLKLSRDRAESVIQALVGTHAIAAARLRSFGNGPFAPVATNGTDDGRALNRRVELVLQ